MEAATAQLDVSLSETDFEMTESQQGLSLRSLRILRAVGAVLVIVSVTLIARYGLSFGRGLTFVSSFSVFATFALLVRDRRAPT